MYSFCADAYGKHPPCAPRYKKAIQASVESVLTSTGSQKELTQAMCHNSAPACRDVREAIHLNTVSTVDLLLLSTKSRICGECV